MYASWDTGKPNTARHREDMGRGGLEPEYADGQVCISFQSSG